MDVDRYVDREIRISLVGVVMDKWRGMEYITVNGDKNQVHMDENMLETRRDIPQKLNTSMILAELREHAMAAHSHHPK